MSKIGRNDPCPCGSGKKYKKCCMNKPKTELPVKGFKQFLDSSMSFEEVNVMSTEEIIETLNSIGISFKKESFLSDIINYYSAEQLSENWFKTLKVSAAGRGKDFSRFAAWVLWKRLAPKNILSMEQMDVLIDKGFEYLADNDSKSACDVWLDVWNAIKFRIKPEFKNLNYLNKQYENTFFIENFCQDLQDELYNAGFQDSVYFEKSVEYCKEFCSYFPDEDELIIHNMRRSIADSFIQMNKIDEAQKELDSLIKDYPDNPWSYIAYGDMYMYEKNLIKDLRKAKEYYEKALTVAKDKGDKKAIEERFEDLNNRMC